MLSVYFGHTHQLAYLDDDLGEGQAALLLRGHFLLYGKAKRIYVRKKPFVFLGNEIGGQPGCRDRIFHERLGGEKGVARSARILPPRSRQIESAGWWETPAHDQLAEPVVKVNYFRLKSGLQLGLRLLQIAPVGCILAIDFTAVRRPSGEAAVPRPLRGKMSITEKPVRTGENIFLSWPVLNPESREACVRKDLTRRLTGVCASMSGVDFEALVLDMTREQLRGERVNGRVFGHS